jgi:hypothetical protein
VDLCRRAHFLQASPPMESVHLPCTFPVPSLYLPCTFPVPSLQASPPMESVHPPRTAGVVAPSPHSLGGAYPDVRCVGDFVTRRSLTPSRNHVTDY